MAHGRDVLQRLGHPGGQRYEYASRVDGAGIGIFFAIIWLLCLVVSVGGAAFWIWQLIEVLKIPEGQFKAAGSEKLTWGLVVGLIGWIGALIWFLRPRKRVLAAAGMAAGPTTAAGWFPDPHGSGRLRWFDGTSWTDHVS